MFGFRPASDGRVLVPGSLRARSIGASANLMSRVGLVVSALALIFTFLLSPAFSPDASASVVAIVDGVQTSSFARQDMSDRGRIDRIVVARAGSTDVFGKIEAIRRMGSRSVLRNSPRLDLIAMDRMENLVESTEVSVRTVTRNSAFRTRVHDGLGRAPPRIDL
ncbi:MAG: hypothetical protein WA138_04405 [Parvibaculum sp.]